jgi:hypothetical protein
MGKFVSTFEKQYQDGNYAAQREVLKQTKSSSEVEPLVRKITIDKEGIQLVMDELKKEYKEYYQKKMDDRRAERFFNDPESLIFRMQKLQPLYSPDQISNYLKILNGVRILTIKDLRYSPQYPRWKDCDLDAISKSKSSSKEIIEFLGFMKRFIESLKLS